MSSSIKNRINFIKKIEQIFKCKKNRKNLSFKLNAEGEIIDFTSKGFKNLKIRSGIPFFSVQENYASNFGFQWNEFRKTQLDSFSGTQISENRFFKSTGWSKNEIKDKLFLDVGCGSGRFSEIILKYGGKVISVDYSSAVYAANENLNVFSNSLVIQADIYDLPFKNETFDFIICLGVLQHTPEVEVAFKSLIPFLKKKGKVCVDYYWNRFPTNLDLKYFFRIFTKKMDQKKIWDLLLIVHPYLFFLSNLVSKIPVLGMYIRRLIPVSNYQGVYNLSDEQLKIWSLLDTFDGLSPKFDKPQKLKDVKNWASDVKLKNINVLHAGHLVVRGVK